MAVAWRNLNVCRGFVMLSDTIRVRAHTNVVKNEPLLRAKQGKRVCVVFRCWLMKSGIAKGQYSFFAGDDVLRADEGELKTAGSWSLFAMLSSAQCKHTF